MNSATLIGSLGWTLVHFVWQGALIGGACAALLLAMRNARAEQRYLVACTALFLCLAWPAWELVQRLSAGHASAAELHFARRILTTGSASAGLMPWLQSQLVWIVGAWAACAAALTLRMALGLLWIGKVTRRHEGNAQWQQRLSNLAAQCGIERPVRLRVVNELASPLTAGWWRPVVLLPTALVSGMPPELLDALLAHELGHIKRCDYLVNLVQNVIEILLFYHPAVWWISHRIRSERELIADDFAARQIGEPRRLAQALSELERLQFSSHHLALAANGGDLMVRIKRLLRPDTQTMNWKAALPVVGLAVAIAAACLHTPAVAKGYTQARVNFATCKKPVWPAASLAAEHTGTVTLQYTVSAQGKALDTSVMSSSGDPALDEAARSGIAKCDFTPATHNGVPETSKMRMQYVWLLN